MAVQGTYLGIWVKIRDQIKIKGATIISILRDEDIATCLIRVLPVNALLIVPPVQIVCSSPPQQRDAHFSYEPGSQCQDLTKSSSFFLLQLQDAGLRRGRCPVGGGGEAGTSTRPFLDGHVHGPIGVHAEDLHQDALPGHQDVS